jgi:Carboxypeptidase regulatory-like domain
MRGTKHSWLAFAGLSAVLLLAGAPAARSQTMTTGDIVGVVTDASSAVVPNAKVTIKFSDTNETHSVVTSPSGQYRFTLLQPGDYLVTAEATGLKSKTEKFTLLVGQETAVNLTLNVQGTQEIIEVQAQATIMQTENANQATGFNTAQMTQLPAGGGDITTIAFTVPGIIQGKGSNTFVTNGIPGANNLFTLNGADDMDPYLNINNSGASNNTLGANEVAEASVVLNAFSADYGRMAGAQVNFVGKSGTNSYHGNLFHNYNDKIFNANSWSNNRAGLTEPRSDSHNFGGSFGGPIRKNKLFFFVNYESLQYALPGSNTRVTIPSPQFQAYTLAHIPAALTTLYNDAFSLWNNAPGAKNAVPVTNGTGPLQDSNNHLGCGNQTFWSSNAQAPGGGVFGGNNVASNVPCSYAFAANANIPNRESLVTVRGDYNITDKQKISARYNYDWGLQATAVSFISPVFNQVSNQPSDQGQLTYTYAISPNLVNNFIGSGSWYTAIFGVADFNKVMTLMPETFSVGDGCCTGVGGSFPNGRNVGQAQLVDDLTWIHGKHSFKAGVNYRFDKITDTSIASSSYKGSYSFADLTDFVTGQINSTGKGSAFTQSFPDIFAAHIREASLGAYVQDEWKIKRNLTLTLGFRIEHDANPACLDNCFARMNTQFGTPGYVGGANVPYNQTISTGLHNEYQSLQAVIAEPRFGFAWSPNSKTVIRGGVGLFASLFSGSSAASVFGNAPSKFSASVKFGEAGPASDPNSSAFAAAAAANVFNVGFGAGDNLTALNARLGGKIAFSAPNYYSPPAEYKPSQVAEWSFEIERTLDSHDVLAATYTGNHGFNEQINNNWANSFLLLGSNGQNATYGTNFGGSTPLPTSAPDPRFLSVSQILTAGYSNYDALTVQIRHSMKWGFQGQFGWTWSHAIGLNTVYNPYNLNFGYGNQSFDSRHTFVGDIIWNEPHKFGNAIVNTVLGGWTVGSKVYIYGGFPFSGSDSKISAQINSGGGIGSILASVVDPHISPTCTAVVGSSATPCYTPAQFETYAVSSGVGTPVQTDFGATGPNTFRGPGYFDIDSTLTKKFYIKERYNLELGAQAYNVLNHPNFTNPNASVTSGSTMGTTGGNVAPPTSPYGSGQGAALVSGRILVVTAKFSF